jgi:predicted dithiol-disulfide oxidoreductase (DUF899 family)
MNLQFLRSKIVDRKAFETQLEALEKAHTSEGDVIAAARRRLPMVEVDGRLQLVGPRGPLSLLEAFEARRQLIAYYFMWHTGHPAPEQCEGRTWVTARVGELSYLHSRDITYAVYCQGPYYESSCYRDFMGWQMPWYSALPSLDTLLVGRQVGLFHLVCYLRNCDRVFETYWTERRGAEVIDYSYVLMDLTVYGGRRSGRTRRLPGRNNAPTRGLAAARPRGNQSGLAETPHRQVAATRSRTFRRPWPRQALNRAASCHNWLRWRNWSRNSSYSRGVEVDGSVMNRMDRREYLDRSGRVEARYLTFLQKVPTLQPSLDHFR